MNFHPNNNDDQCQHPNGCTKSFFTYCPHCHLYLCIIHLNQHHDTIKKDIHQTINEAENHRVSLEQQMCNMKQQQAALNDLYEHEMKNLNKVHQFVTSICNNNYLLISEYERCAKQMQSIKEEHANNSFTQSFMLQIDQILQQHSHADSLGSKDQISMTKNILSVANNETTTDMCSESFIEEKELMIDSTMEDTSIDEHHEPSLDTLSLESKSLANSVYSACPLSHANAFGFSAEHNIPGVPCNDQANCTNLTPDRCYYHLMSCHRLKQSAARIILKAISSVENKNADFTTLDLFSHWKSADILSQGTTLYIGQCPLTERHAYGLQNHLKVALCTPRPSLHLYQHLRCFHHLKANHARRLIAALIQNKPPTEELFKPHEQIIHHPSRATS